MKVSSLAFLLLTAAAPVSQADPDLPVRAGIEFRFAASDLSGETVSAWPDGSGRSRALSAPSREASPRLVKEGGAAVVRFDGKDDRLIHAGGPRLKEMTLFAVFAAHSSPGGYRCIASANAAGKNDYLSGFNLDQGGAGGVLNAEGRGFAGETNLLGDTFTPGVFVTLSLSISGKQVRLRVNGKDQGNRERTDEELDLAQFRLGARHFSNSAAPTSDQGFFHGDLAEVLVYGRALSGTERDSVESFLRAKHAPLLGGKALVVDPTMPVTMVVPGFTVRRLPVRLTNINNVDYAPDGRLIALGYDGRIHALRDTDGDGLEDEVKPWWYQGEGDFRGPIGMVLAKEGIYVASKGRVTLVKDTDGDGAGDAIDVVATGWPEILQAVDTVGLALDKDGALYFGLGCANFANAFLLDKQGKAHYDLRNERGTIQKLAPDRKSRETICSGVRFTVALAINRHGDLFCTDQEGETWMPNGNPLDELLHLQPGRSYGFPPRHPEHNPEAIDEGAVVTFGPQHQSTCGLKFNEAKGGWKAFGPPNWEGNALIAGESRGKIWRVPLVKTPSGYVGKHALIASLSMLLIDVAVAPNGDLVATCHSGPPDWGTGPKGQGQLFKIQYADRAAPQPVAAWPSGPLEARVAFDRPIDPSADLSAEIVFGEFVSAGDRHEVLHPPYKVLEEQRRAVRIPLKVTGRTLSEDRRTLTFSTAPHPWRATYAVTLGKSIDLSYDLSGANLSWTSERGRESWNGWVPSPDPNVVAGLLRGSAEHDRLLACLEKSGTYELKSQIALPAGKTHVRLVSTHAFGAELDGRGLAVKPAGKTFEASVSVDSPKEALLLAVTGKTGEGFSLRALARTEPDPHEKPLRLEHLLVPWAPPHRPPKPAPLAAASAGPRGDWAGGKALFFGEGKCSQCHTLRGEGGKAAPDLSNLVHWDPPRILKEILEPNATINPDYVNHLVALKDGRRLSGVVLPDGPDRLRIIDTEAKELVVGRKDVQELKPSSVSIMPDTFKSLGEAKLTDLVTFLTSTTPQGAPPRKRAEVDAVLALATETAGERPRPLKVVLVTGPKDHGPGEHDYPAWLERWKVLLGKSAEVRISTAFKAPDRGQWELADLMVFYFMDGTFWTDERYRELDAYLERGGGLVLLHSACIPGKEPAKLAQRIGLCWEPGKTKFRHGALELKIDGRSPLARGLRDFKVDDEVYWPLLGDLSKVDLLATQEEEGQPRAMAWTYRPGKGRVFGTLLGHYHASWDDPYVRLVVLRGMAWAAGEPVDRFKGLVTEGVTLRE